MTSKTVYPTSVSQSSQTNTRFREFGNLGNIKNNKDTYAKTGQIASKSGTHNRPSSITCKGFNANIPAGSTINKVTVEYAADYEGNISIGKSTVNILNISGANQNGKALTKTMTKTSVSWSGNHNISNINSNNFGVTISFPTNTKADVGYVKVKYVRIIIDYTSPNYSVTSSKISGTYTNEEHKIMISASNVAKTNEDTNVTINLPGGVSYIGKDSGDGSISSSGSKLTWKPGLSNKKLNANIILRLNVTSDGEHVFNISESATGHKTTISFNTNAKPHELNVPQVTDPTPTTPVVTDEQAIPITETPTERQVSQQILQIDINEEFEIDLNFEDYNGEIHLYAYKNNYAFDSEKAERTEDILLYSVSMGQWHFRPLNYWESNYKYWTYRIIDVYRSGVINRFKITNSGNYSIQIYAKDDTTLLKSILIYVKPSELSSKPIYSVMKLTPEELDRLGEGISYTVQSFFKLETNELFVRENGNNFKIGVFNNINPNIDVEEENIIEETTDSDGDELTIEPVETELIDETDYENLTPSQILEYAEYWSDPIKLVNEFVDTTVDFVYNKNYPLYIIITGDYAELNPKGTDLHFTEPCIIESRVYNGFEKNGNFPIPITNLTLNENSSEISLNLFEMSNGIIFYKFPLGENFGVTDDTVITGIELTGEIQYADELSITAKLCKPDGNSGERSIIIDPDDSTFKIGGSFDLWHFKISDMTNLEDWWVEFSLNNIFENLKDIGELKFNNIQLTIYTNQIEPNPLTMIVDGENVGHYGMFIQNINIPEGLETDTKYINIDGTDTNDASRMNIASKEIEIEFSVFGCTIEETTVLLRQLAKLFVNDRDELNRPIPKRLEISTYPDVYFEYIMEKPFDTDVEASDFNSSVKLTIPAGTAFSKENIVTNYVGINNGIAKVNPVITFVPLGDTVELSETVTNQNFKITCKDWSQENTVKIDCINQTITILDAKDSEGNSIEKDITSLGDFNNDWFILHREYNFEQNNCIIKTVSFTERW